MAHKKYKIETLTDMVNATTPENIDNFLKDLKGLLESMHMILDIADLSGVRDEVDIVNTYTWTDDGANKINIELRVKDK